MRYLLKSYQFFWHPWHPWERLSSGDIWVLRFVLNILLTWRHLVEIFIFIKMIYHVSFIILVHHIVIFSLLISIKLIITKIHHLISLRFERSELKKSQCASITNFLKSYPLLGKDFMDSNSRATFQKYVGWKKLETLQNSKPSWLDDFWH